jgi:hypothetical protein
MNEYNVLVGMDPDGNLVFSGAADAASTHLYGMPHTTVLLVPVVQIADGEPCLILHQRSQYKRTSPGKLDFNGGHLVFSDGYFAGKAWESAYDLERATLDAAVREGNEEIRFTPHFRIRPETLIRFGGLGAFDCRTETAAGPNVEFSTCFLVPVPSQLGVRIFDTDPMGERELTLSKHTLAELLDRFRGEQDLFADGAGRILSALAGSQERANDFRKLMVQAGHLSRQPLHTYRVIWEDTEDGRTGETIEVAAGNPPAAFETAAEFLSGWAKKFVSSDIECLVDEHGEYHRPQFFLT